MGIARLGHVELLCPEFEADREQFMDIIGLQESLRENGRSYLRAYREWDKYSLILTKSDRRGVGHIAFQVEEEDDLEMYADRIQNSGYEVTWQEAGAEPGQGKSIRFQTPADQEFELFHTIDRVDVPEAQQSDLVNQPQKRVKHGIGPTRIDHGNLFVRDAAECLEWFSDVLDLELREYLTDENGDKVAVWMSGSSLVHDIAFGEGDEVMLNHVAYDLKENSEIFRAADLFKEYDVDIACGPARHGIGQAYCLYYKTPSLNQMELYSGGYHIFDPNWEPIEWTLDDLPEAIYWYGKGRDWSPTESEGYRSEDYDTGE